MLACTEKEQPDESLSCSSKKVVVGAAGSKTTNDWNLKDLQEIRENP